ncbi:MAG: hypothetical protein CME70_24260 [Halobacteriovorax sp.]|nr:hypothetical protein [Halobacteriovorax sp.]|tara:strand:+ start:30263 stop:30589 length:327 start_codon:yes stop_codon:yes gene_type:complete
MKRDELKCPSCNDLLTDLKSSFSCKSCKKYYQIKISRKGVQLFFFLLLPSSFFITALFILNWKLSNFLDMPSRDFVLGGAILVGVLGLIISSIKMKSEFEVGKEIKKA